MKVVLIQPYYSNIWEALGLGYIGSYVKKNYKGDLDLQFYQGNFDGDYEVIKGCEDADYVAFSCTTPAYPHAERLEHQIRKRNNKAVFIYGGWHPTALPHKCTTDRRQIVCGEGEHAFLQILEGDTDPIVYGTKLGWDELPWPDRDLIKNERTIDLCNNMIGKKITSFQANRVCPVHCVFCSEHIMTGKMNRKTNPIRSRDVKDVCDEIEFVIDRYGIDYFKFVDATFDVSAQYVIDFCQEKIKRNINLEWEALVHASFATEEMFYWLRESNCEQINVGVESGSDKVLRTVGKGTKTEVVRRVFEWGKKYGIERRAFFILGMPNETREDIFLTEKLVDEIQPDVVGFTILCPYPGTPLYNEEMMKNVDWAVMDEYSNPYWSTEHFTNRELHAWQAYFTTKFKEQVNYRQKELIDAC